MQSQRQKSAQNTEAIPPIQTPAKAGAAGAPPVQMQPKRANGKPRGGRAANGNSDAVPPVQVEIPKPAEKSEPTPRAAALPAGKAERLDALYDSPPHGAHAHARAAQSGLIYILQILLAKWRLVMLTVIFGVVVGVLQHRSQVTSYSATSIIKMTVRKPRIMKQDEAVIDQSSYWGTDELLNTRLHILRGRAIRDRVARELPEHYPGLDVDSSLIRAAVSGATLTQVKGTHLIHISCVTGNESLPVPVVNTYARVAGASIQDDIDQTSEAAVQWLRDQSEAQRSKLHKAEDMLMVFRQRNKIDEIENEKQTAEQLLEGLSHSLVQADTEAMMAKSMVDALSKSQINQNNAGELPSSLPNVGQIQTALTKLVDATEKRNLLLVKYTEEHPQVKEAVKRIESERRQFDDTIERAKKTAQANLSLVEQQVRTLRARKAEMENRLVEVQKQIVTFNIELEGLNRKLKTDEITYDELLRRIEEARLATEENTALVTLVQEAQEPPAAVRPHLRRTLVLAALLGLAAGCGLAYVSYHYEDFVSDMPAIKHELGAPLLGIVPQVTGSPKTRDIALSCVSDKFGSVAEAFSGIRVALNARMQATGTKNATLVVTGSGPREGKTSTSCNLAITMAQSGRRTLLIDADMRRPELHRVFDIPREAPSLMGALIEESRARFRDLPYQTGVPNLWVVSGNNPIEGVNPAQILGGNRVKQLIDWARTEFDQVVVDTPPIGIFSDARILGTVVDGVLMVCRCDKSRKTAVRHGMEELAKSGANVIGIIVCDLPRSRLAAKLGYGRYYYGYGYDPYQYYDRYRPAPT